MVNPHPDPRGRAAIRTESAPRPAGHYSQAVRAGDFLFIAGQVPRRADGSYEPAEIEAEVALTLHNLASIASAAGQELRQAVKLTIYLASLDDFSRVDAAYREFFDSTPPARTTVGAALRQVQVEMDAIIYCPAAS
jgi:2-iminobutanoate/2-iminopropanoate deaminase